MNQADLRRIYSTIWLLTFFSALLLFLPLAGCGKKGPPMPDYSGKLFSWRNVTATHTVAGCLSIAGAVEGSAMNVQDIILELQAVDETCIGCPFVPQEIYRIDAAKAWQNPADAYFSFAYCPAEKADAYRWRLVGRNSLQGMPLTLTPVATVGNQYSPRTE